MKLFQFETDKTDTHVKKLQKQYLSQSDTLRESDQLSYSILATFVICTVITLLIIWASLTKIDEVANAHGKIITKNKVHTMQYLQSGIISELPIQNGQLVTKGQLLAQTDTTAIKAELKQVRAKELSLLINTERLRAFLEGKDKGLEVLLKRVIESSQSPYKNLPDLKRFINESRDFLNIQNISRHDQVSVLKAQIKKQREEVNAFIKQETLLKEQIELFKKEQEMYENLKNQHYYSKRDYIRVLREANSTQSKLATLLSDKIKAEQGLSELNEKLNSLLSKLHHDAISQLNDNMSDLLEVQQSIRKLEVNLQQSTITSPIKGIIKGLSVNKGSVVAPGEKLFEIIPINSQLQAEIKILPKDIGHIKIGNLVKLKMMSYDFARYGTVKGQLINISPSTFDDDQETGPYYKGTIKLDKQYMGANPKVHLIKPGMTVQADIINGEKTLLEYLLKPIHTTLSSSFHER